MVAALVCFALFATGCGSVAIRLENASTVDFTDVTLAGTAYGDLPAGAMTDYRDVDLKFRYGVLRLTGNGHRVNAQTLNLRARRFTYRIHIIDLAKGHLDVEVLPEKLP